MKHKKMVKVSLIANQQLARFIKTKHFSKRRKSFRLQISRLHILSICEPTSASKKKKG